MNRCFAAEIEGWVLHCLGVPIACAQATAPLPVACLSAAESAELAALPAPRRGTWRLGRAAVKSLFGALGWKDEAAGLIFPHPLLSLTHAGGVAVAVHRLDNIAGGIGVDLEPGRDIVDGAARLFLSTRERSCLDAKGALRLWTVKEAVYKADLGQRGWLGSYRVIDPGGYRGRALHQRGTGFRYCSRPLGDGFVSVAVPG